MQSRMWSGMGIRAKENHPEGDPMREDVVRAIQSGAVAAGVFSFPAGTPLPKKLREAARVWQAMSKTTVSESCRLEALGAGRPPATAES